MSDGFADSINKASAIPENQGNGANVDIPSGPLGIGQFPIPDGEPVIDNVKPPDALGKHAVKGVTKYNLTACVRRFIMGRVYTRETDDEGKSYSVPEERDDSGEYERILNLMLSGEAVRSWEERTVLKDGTVIIALCYLVKKDPKQPMQSSEPPPSPDAPTS